MKAILYTSILFLSLGMAIGFSISQKYYMNNTREVVVRPYGYTIIDYDSVLWSDGRRTKYDWHLYRGIANEK